METRSIKVGGKKFQGKEKMMATILKSKKLRRAIIKVMKE